MLKLRGTRVLGVRDREAVLRALDVDPYGACVVASRVQACGMKRSSLGGELWARGAAERALCFSGGNLIPLSGDPHDLAAFADRALRGPRVCTAVVGRRELVLPVWSRLAPHWGPARDVRADQPLLALPTPPKVAGDPLVEPVSRRDMQAYFDASVAMFTEEVGVDPRGRGGARRYRERVEATVHAGRAWARVEDGRVVFKAEIGSSSDRVDQIQGVWVHPDLRGRGLGTRGTARVCAEIRAAGRTPSLYVNEYNRAARAAYHRIGFDQVGTFATVLID